MASHCSSKFGGTASPASAGTAGPHWPRNSRTCASWFGSLAGLGSGIQTLSWNAPLLLLRTYLAQARISSGCINNTPQAPSPPALQTATESDGAEAPAIGASRIGARSPNLSQKSPARPNMLLIADILSVDLVRSSDGFRSSSSEAFRWELSHSVIYPVTAQGDRI